MTTSPFGAMAVIADPAMDPSRIEEARHAIEARGLDHEVLVAAGDRTVSRLAAAAMDDGCRYLVALGDDRTVQDVLNGMFRDGRPIADDPVLGVMPAGECDLVRTFGLPPDLEAASRHLVGEETYGLDVMKVAVTGSDGARQVRYGHNLAEVGFHAAATARSARLAARWGGLGRFVGFWSAYAGSRMRSVHLDVDARPHDLRAWSVVVGNGQFAGGVRLSPRSFPGDGIVDCLAFVGPRSDAYRMLPALFRHGDHIPSPGIKELRARITLQVAADRPMPVVLDGRPIGTTPVTFQVMPQPVRLKL
jgi:diacylglycerol kinase family enzyme